MLATRADQLAYPRAFAADPANLRRVPVLESVALRVGRRLRAARGARRRAGQSGRAHLAPDGALATVPLGLLPAGGGRRASSRGPAITHVLGGAGSSSPRARKRRPWRVDRSPSAGWTGRDAGGSVTSWRRPNGNAERCAVYTNNIAPALRPRRSSSPTRPTEYVQARRGWIPLPTSPPRLLRSRESPPRCARRRARIAGAQFLELNEAQPKLPAWRRPAPWHEAAGIRCCSPTSSSRSQRQVERPAGGWLMTAEPGPGPLRRRVGGPLACGTGRSAAAGEGRSDCHAPRDRRRTRLRAVAVECRTGKRAVDARLPWQSGGRRRLHTASVRAAQLRALTRHRTAGGVVERVGAVVG